MHRAFSGRRGRERTTRPASTAAANTGETVMVDIARRPPPRISKPWPNCCSSVLSRPSDFARPRPDTCGIERGFCRRQRGGVTSGTGIFSNPRRPMLHVQEFVKKKTPWPRTLELESVIGGFCLRVFGFSSQHTDSYKLETGPENDVSIRQPTRVAKKIDVLNIHNNASTQTRESPTTKTRDWDL